MAHSKQYDLEERTLCFAQKCRDYVRKLPKTIANEEYGRQLIRSSGSQAANYIEANESLGRKDFIFRLEICRKETKESSLWLKLSEIDAALEDSRQQLIQESIELRKIFSSIINKINELPRLKS